MGKSIELLEERENVGDVKISEMTLIQKLAKIRDMAAAAKRSKSGYNYKYVDAAQILANVTAGMNKYHVSLVPKIVPGSDDVSQNVMYKTKTKKNGDVYEDKTTEMLVRATLEYTWVNDDQPSDSLKVPWVLVGSQPDPAQALGTALTYAQRQFLLMFFQIAQVDKDIEEYRKDQKEAEDKEDIAVAKEITTELSKMIREYLANHPDGRESVIKLLKKYDKTGNPDKIKDPNLAGEALREFRKTFIKNEKKEGIE